VDKDKNSQLLDQSEKNKKIEEFLNECGGDKKFNKFTQYNYEIDPNVFLKNEFNMLSQIIQMACEIEQITQTDENDEILESFVGICKIPTNFTNFDYLNPILPNQITSEYAFFLFEHGILNEYLQKKYMGYCDDNVIYRNFVDLNVRENKAFAKDIYDMLQWINANINDESKNVLINFNYESSNLHDLNQMCLWIIIQQQNTTTPEPSDEIETPSLTPEPSLTTNPSAILEPSEKIIISKTTPEPQNHQKKNQQPPRRLKKSFFKA
jgi:hypothetical protein